MVLDALAREFDSFCTSKEGIVEFLLGCDFIEEIFEVKSAMERKKMMLELEPEQRRGLLEVYAERLLNDALEEYEWSVRGGAEHGEVVGAALELVRKILKGKRPETLQLRGSEPCSAELEGAVIAGARVTFQENPDPMLCENVFAIEVPVTGSRQETAKRLLAATYSLMLVLDGPGPCDLRCPDIPYREYVVELPCPRDPVTGFSVRGMAEVSSSARAARGGIPRVRSRDEALLAGDDRAQRGGQGHAPRSRARQDPEEAGRQERARSAALQG